MLRSVLRQRTSASEGIWVDERCIDQDNASEMSHTIGVMDIVYRSARLVVVVIEDIGFSEEETVFLRELVAEFDRSSSYSTLQQEDGSHFDIVVRLLFIFFFPAGNGIVEIPIETIESFFCVIRNYDSQVGLQADIIETPFLSYDLIARALENASQDRGRDTLMIEFLDVDQLECSIEADKISISLNIAGLQLYFRGQNSDRCCWLLGMIARCARNATIFGGESDTL